MGPEMAANSRTCTATEMACTRLYCRFRAQRGLTGTGLLVSFKGGSLGGAIRSRRLRQKTLYSGCCSNSMLELEAPLILGVRKAALRLSEELLSRPYV